MTEKPTSVTIFYHDGSDPIVYDRRTIVMELQAKVKELEDANQYLAEEAGRDGAEVKRLNAKIGLLDYWARKGSKPVVWVRRLYADASMDNFRPCTDQGEDKGCGTYALIQLQLLYRDIADVRVWEPPVPTCDKCGQPLNTEGSGSSPA